MCKYYDEKKKLCSIYYERPIICNVDQFYEARLEGAVEREIYYRSNYAVCEKLKRSINKESR